MASRLSADSVQAACEKSRFLLEVLTQHVEQDGKISQGEIDAIVEATKALKGAKPKAGKAPAEEL